MFKNLATTLLLVLSLSLASKAQTIYGLAFDSTNGYAPCLIEFEAANPATIKSKVYITGLDGFVIGLTHNAQNDLFYLLVTDEPVLAGNFQLYTLNPVSGIASPLGSPKPHTFIDHQVAFGFDANNKLILVNNTEINQYNIVARTEFNTTDGSKNRFEILERASPLNYSVPTPLDVVVLINQQSKKTLVTEYSFNTDMHKHQVSVAEVTAQKIENYQQLDSTFQDDTTASHTVYYDALTNTNTIYGLIKTNVSPFLNQELYALNYETGERNILGITPSELLIADILIKGKKDIAVINETEQTKLLVYPNPTTKELRLQNNIGEQFMLYDNLGKLVKHVLLLQENQVIDISDLAKGEYYLHVGKQEAKILVSSQ